MMQKSIVHSVGGIINYSFRTPWLQVQLFVCMGHVFFYYFNLHIIFFLSVVNVLSQSVWNCGNLYIQQSISSLLYHFHLNPPSPCSQMPRNYDRWISGVHSFTAHSFLFPSPKQKYYITKSLIIFWEQTSTQASLTYPNPSEGMIRVASCLKCIL